MAEDEAVTYRNKTRSQSKLSSTAQLIAHVKATSNKETSSGVFSASDVVLSIIGGVGWALVLSRMTIHHRLPSPASKHELDFDIFSLATRLCIYAPLVLLHK
ncbi:hypothetical protein PMAYCL1PPCAC_27625 [Pristionchus mayeri]|uniref:Uncharacterized protein n=1 Tax=Pristionchus mayeri TaxID=1317129 RepID=A0AAN5D868_9BILA|nr:hypothetical protein PMAYCL1PPCAC_27625 [Pristionchus mayeri]